MDHKAKVLIVSDDPATANIWGFTLTQTGLDVTLIDIRTDFLKVFENTPPDLILIEDFNDEIEELKICRQLRALTVVPILYLTSKNSEKFLVDTYQAGADESITHPISPRLFQAKVTAWLRRTRDFPLASLDQVQAAGFTLDPDQKRLALPNRQWIKLTLLETRLLYNLMSHPGQKLTSEELIQKVWGYQNQVDRKLLKNHIYRLRQKIEPDPAHPQTIVSVGYSGYWFCAGPADPEMGAAG